MLQHDVARFVYTVGLLITTGLVVWSILKAHSTKEDVLESSSSPRRETKAFLLSPQEEKVPFPPLFVLISCGKKSNVDEETGEEEKCLCPRAFTLSGLVLALYWSDVGTAYLSSTSIAINAMDFTRNHAADDLMRKNSTTRSPDTATASSRICHSMPPAWHRQHTGEGPSPSPGEGVSEPYRPALFVGIDGKQRNLSIVFQSIREGDDDSAARNGSNRRLFQHCGPQVIEVEVPLWASGNTRQANTDPFLLHSTAVHYSKWITHVLATSLASVTAKPLRDEATPPAPSCVGLRIVSNRPGMKKKKSDASPGVEVEEENGYASYLRVLRECRQSTALRTYCNEAMRWLSI